MEMNEKTRIRLRFSSIVNYSAMVYRMLVAIGFIVVVARRLSVGEFGLWGIVWSTSLMLASLTGLWVFWAQRFIARGIKGVFGTSLLLCLAYCVIGGTIYVGIALLEEMILGWGLWYMLWGLPLFWLNVLGNLVSGISAVVKPEVIGFRGFIYETLRLIFAFVFVVVLGWGLLGAIISVELALLVSVVYGFVVLWGTRVIDFNVSRSLIVEWFKGFYVPLLNVIYGFLRSGIRVVVSWATGSEVPVAYLNVGFASQAPIVSAAGAATPALYARVLRKGGGGDVEEVLRIFFLLNGFMVSMFIFLSRSIASLYNPLYVDAWIIIAVISLYAFINGLMNIFVTVAIGASRVDEEGVLLHREVFSSYLFRAPLMRLVSLLVSYGVGLGLEFFLRGDHLLEALAFALGLLIGIVVFLYWFYRIANQSIPFKLPLREIGIAVIAGLAMGLYYIVSNAYNIVIHRFWDDAPWLGLHVLVAGAIYFTIWYLLSPWFKGILKSGLRLIYGR